jgi:hypothetical protein
MDNVMANMLKQADDMQTTIATMEDAEPDRADGGYRTAWLPRPGT